MDKSSVKVAKSKKGLDLFNSGWGRPLGHAMTFSEVHMYLAMFNDDAKVFNRGLIKGALFRLEIKVILLEALEYFMS